MDTRVRDEQLNSSLLLYQASGVIGNPPVVLLHDRYGDQDQLAEVGHDIEECFRVYAVRGPRAQMAGNGREVHGYYWYIGESLSQPEASTFGDGLFQVEQLLFDLLEKENQGQKFILVGQGQGGVVALTLAMIWPELLQSVVAIDATLPENLLELPLEAKRLDGVRFLLISKAVDDPILTKEGLERLGGWVEIANEVQLSTSRVIRNWI